MRIQFSKILIFTLIFHNAVRPSFCIISSSLIAGAAEASAAVEWNKPTTTSRKLQWFKIPRPVEDIQFFKKAIFKGNGTVNATVGEKSCFNITTINEGGFKVDVLIPVASWHVILRSDSNSNSNLSLVSAYVKYVPSMGDYEACYILRRKGIYKATAYLEYFIDDEHKVYGTSKYHKVKEFKIVGEEEGGEGEGGVSNEEKKKKKGMLDQCTPELLAKEHNRYGSWEDSTYQSPSCEFRHVSSNEAMNCMGEKNIAVFGDPTLKILSTHLSQFLANETFFSDAPYSLAWFQSYIRTTSSTDFDPASGNIPYLSLRLGHRVSAQLYGNGWDGYGRIHISPLCENQKPVNLWIFSHNAASEPLFQAWMDSGEGFGRLWPPSDTKFDYVIAGTSIYDPDNFDTLDLYKTSVRRFANSLVALVRDGSPNRVIWLGNIHNQDPRLGDPRHIYKVSIGENHGVHRHFSEAAFQVVNGLGLTWFDLLPMHFPSFDRCSDDAEMDDPDHFPPTMKAISILLLSSICPPSSLVSPPPEQCIDRTFLRNSTEGLPNVDVRFAIGHEMEMIEDPGEEFDPDNLIGKTRDDKKGEEDPKVNASQREWPPSDILSRLPMKKSIPGDRMVIMSVKELRKWKKKKEEEEEEEKLSKEKNKNKNGPEGDDKDSTSRFLHGWPIVLERSRMTWQSRIKWRTAVRLHPLVSYHHYVKCMIYRSSYCYNGASKYRAYCPWTELLSQAVASGSVDRCEKWCPMKKQCVDILPNPDFLNPDEKSNQRSIVKSPISFDMALNMTFYNRSDLRQIVHRLPLDSFENKPAWLGTIQEAFVSRCGDVYTDEIVLFPHGECYVWNGPPYHCSLDLDHAIQHAVRKVYVADGVNDGDNMHSMVFECLASLMPYYDELMNDTSIYIHVKGIEGGEGEYPSRLNEMFDLLNLNSSRIIAHDVYVHEVTVGRPTCRVPFSVHEVNYLLRLRTLIQQKLQNRTQIVTPKEKEKGKEKEKEKYILLVQNSWHRKVLNNDELVTSLRKITNLKVVVFEDDGTVSMEEVWTTFLNAYMVIGPHGNSLVHIIVCRSGTPLLEFMVPFLDYDDTVHANIVYELMATGLGMPYYVMVPEYHVPFDEGRDGDPYFLVDANRVARLVQEIMEDTTLGLKRWEKVSDVRQYVSGY